MCPQKTDGWCSDCKKPCVIVIDRFEDPGDDVAGGMPKLPLGDWTDVSDCCGALVLDDPPEDEEE